jgi:hypothetical protein
MELPFSARQRLCVPMLERIEVLTGPERGALGAFGRSAGEAPDRFLVGLAVLGLLWNSRRSSHSSASFYVISRGRCVTVDPRDSAVGLGGCRP